MVGEGGFPKHPVRQRIEREVAKRVREHLIVYVSHDEKTQVWQWVKRELGRPERTRTHVYHRGRTSELLVQKLERLHFTLEEEEKGLSIVDVAGRVGLAFDVEKVTKQFYERFQREHSDFLGFIEGVLDVAGREWYASVMLNRLMFIYFIQKKGFLNGDTDYLRTNLSRSKAAGPDRFYKTFLCPLFFEGFAKPPNERREEARRQLGEVPYLNGGIFQRHPIEREHGENIRIPGKAFERLFGFFEQYQWHLEDRPLRKANEINPDVLGYIFEKYINQKQMGAYYTKEDITGYIGRNTILPFLFGEAQKSCAIAFEPSGGVWRLLAEEPDRYIYGAERHGMTYDIHQHKELAEKRELPGKIAVGVKDVGKREGWNDPAEVEYGLPTETWREHVGRRRRYEEVRAKLAAGEVRSIEDLVTYNLDIEKFARDVIQNSEGPELVRAFWKALGEVSVLDPTCGSGAFLFAALNLLEPLYGACLEAMRGFVGDVERAQSTPPPPPPAKLEDFREVLERMEGHASERYFILKSIIMGNLYGVDIMEEAVEICKLRLFLKLVAQVEKKEDIEPLPDIDFNVRSGNTLVGFASLEEVKEALGSDLIKQQSLPQIEERAAVADIAFGKFRRMQTELDMDVNQFNKAKEDLQERLEALRGELDGYLAKDYGVKMEDKGAYKEWQRSHRPFHWFVEFYRIMRQGGFDVIIGNPPYVEYSKVKKDRKEGYTIKNYKTLPCSNLYAFCIERVFTLLRQQSWFSFVVPISIQTTSRMSSLQQLFIQEKRHTYFSTFDVYPSKLFEGGKQRISLIIATERLGKSRFWTTFYNRWRPEERSKLFSNLLYFRSYLDKNCRVIPKLGNRTAEQILHKLSKFSIAPYKRKPVSPSFYVHGIPYNYVKVFDFVPYFWNEIDGQKKSVDLRPYQLERQELRGTVLAMLNSNLFFWWWYSLFDGYHCGRHEILSFPGGIREMKDEICENLSSLAERLMRDYKRHSRRRVANYKATGRVEYDEYYPRKSKSIIDEIDRVLAKHYGFTEEELDFIINYDIKYRMGLKG